MQAKKSTGYNIGDWDDISNQVPSALGLNTNSTQNKRDSKTFV